MSLTSAGFVAFLAAVVVLYYLLPKKCQWIILLLASCGFYMAGGPMTILYLLFTALSTYAAGRCLGMLNSRRDALPAEEKKAKSPMIKARKQFVVAVAVILNFGLLYALKYWNFTADVFSRILPLPRLDLLMPLGISFYMFQSIGYVVDCYRGKYPPERNVLKYCLFVSFFPQVIQGPISRFDQLAPQLTAEHAFNADDIKQGIQLLMWGYFKKLVIADRAAVVVNKVFDNYPSYGGVIIALSVVFYAIQLYCDFSGGIDITRGAARMLGIEMTENFRRPLFAKSLAEYWRRWHISLGTWMKDYVFYSLTLSKPFLKLGKWSRRRIGGKLGKVIPTSAATFVVYFIIGIWHGANFRYLFFGLWNGAVITGSMLLANQFYSLRQKLHISDECKLYNAFCMVRTWALVCFGRYITRAPRLMSAFSMMLALLTRPCVSNLWDGTVLKLGLSAFDLVVVLLGSGVMVLAECIQERGGSIGKWLDEKPAFVQWLGIAVPLVALLVLGLMRGNYISSEFIYKQF